MSKEWCFVALYHVLMRGVITGGVLLGQACRGSSDCWCVHLRRWCAPGMQHISTLLCSAVGR